MKRILLFLVLCNSVAFTQNGKIEIKIFGFESLEGSVNIGLFNSAEGFPQKSIGYMGKVIPVDSDTIFYTFYNIPLGDYAIAIFHDKNNNGELDKNFFGIPSESYIFSNDAEGTFGPPDFEEAKFTIKEDVSLHFNLNK